MGATHAHAGACSTTTHARGLRLEHQAQALHRKLAVCARDWRRGLALGAYTTNRAHYSAGELDEKRAFVRQAVGDCRAARVLDLGANTGEFSELAAAKARVVALDIDEQSVSGIAERARSRNLDIHPLVGDLAQPTPAAGWKNAETRSLLTG